MLKVYICEDDYYQQFYLKKIISKTICIENYDMELSLATSDPYKLLNDIKNTNHTGIYFLDVHLNSDINGIELAEKIRFYDPRCFIVFITADSNKSNTIFLHKIEAMDYILKTDLNNIPIRIGDCMRNAYNRYTTEGTKSREIFTIKINDKIINIHYDKILYFETSKTIHKVIVHCENKKLEFYRKMKELEEILDDRFCRCHTSFIVNKDKIKEINKKDRIAHMINDEKCLISTRALKYLIKQ